MTLAVTTARVMLDCTPDFKPGDLPPDGYLAWNAWAEVQRKAGIKQVCCAHCCLWKTPQELSAHPFKLTVRNRYGEPYEREEPVCQKCYDKQNP